MLVKTLTAAIQGIEAIAVTVEIHLSRGIKFSLVGLPDNAIRESHERIISALRENNMDIPRKQIVINMSPANLKKEGTSYDLPLTVGLMAAEKYIPQNALKNTLFVGELSLDGTLQPIKGVLPIALLCRDLKLKKLILPMQNAREAGVVNNIQVIGIKNIKELRDYLNDNIEIEDTHIKEKDLFDNKQTEDIPDFSDVKGQEEVKRAIEVACSGSHNILLIGPPGAGKTMMAKCIPGILPPISLLESLETTKIHSVAGKTLKNESIITTRPFIAPHHSISSVALVGGGSKPKPGEISLAHNGILFLDELPEFQRNALEVLRQPLEDGTIRISRSNYDVIYPANFMLVASMNPCPCGYYNHPTKECVCTPGQIKRYMNKISGPLLDRIDIQMEIIPVPFEELNSNTKHETSTEIRERVIKARKIQDKRFKNNKNIHSNADMGPKEIKKYTSLNQDCIALLKNAMEKLNLSARAYTRILKVSRTIADLDNSKDIKSNHIAEAINYRALDNEHWGE